MSRQRGVERDLYAPVISLLREYWDLDKTAVLAEEVSLHGRLVDLVVLAPGGKTRALEFKIRDTKRAFEQAAFNRLSFSQSFVVLGVMPSRKNLSLAADLGIGVIHVGVQGAKLILEGVSTEPADAITQRVVARILSGREGK